MARTVSEIRSEMKKVTQSFHVKAYVNMRQLSLSLYTFNENHALLRQHLESYNDIDPLLISDIFNRKSLRWEYHPLEQKKYQLFLNFVASAKALIDHTRNIVRELYTGTEFYKEYNKKVAEELAMIPIRVFVQDLRSYVLHNKFPFVGRQLRLERSISAVKLTLSKKQLLKWDGWTEPSKRYLKAQDDQIFLDVLIDEYYLLIERFYLWLDKRQREMHESEYSWLLDQWEELYQELEKFI